MSRRFLRRALAWAILALPLAAIAHDDKAILARVELLDNGVVSLRVTIDADTYEGKKDPVRLLSSDDPPLLFIVNGQPTRPNKLKRVYAGVKSQSHFDRASPLGHSDDENIRYHALLTAEWMWEPLDPPFSLRVPDDSPHAFFFWVVNARNPSEPSKPLLLTKGMETPRLEANVPSLIAMILTENRRPQRDWTHYALGFLFRVVLPAGILWLCWKIAKKLVPW